MKLWGNLKSNPAGKKRRSNGSDTLVYLRAKGEKEQEMKKLSLICESKSSNYESWKSRVESWKSRVTESKISK